MTTSKKPHIVKLSTPADIIGAVPATVGFHPTESLVVVCLNGPRKRYGLTMRYDLPSPDHDAAMATDIADRATAQNADAVLLVCFTEDPDDGAELPRHRLIDRVIAELGDRDVGVGDMLLVRDGRWWSYTCSKPCCPREGTPAPGTPTGPATEYAAQLAMAGRTVLADRESLEKSVRGPVALRRIALEQRYAQATEQFAAEVAARGLEAARARTLQLAAVMLGQFEEGRVSLDDTQVCRVLAGLLDVHTRDALIAWGVPDDRGSLIAMLSELAQCALDDDAAPICSVLAGVAYLDGDGALANVALERALRCDPGYSLALLLDTALQGMLDPAHFRRAFAELADDFPRPRCHPEAA
jgi:hypothetical protein